MIIVAHTGGSSRNNGHSHASSASQETSDSDQCSIKTQITNSQPETPANDAIDSPLVYEVYESSDSSSRAQQRPSHLELRAQQPLPQHSAHHNQHHQQHERPRFQFSVESDDTSGPVIVTDSDNSVEQPTSMPPLHHSGSNVATFSHKNPAYQSANPTCGTLTLPHQDPAKAKTSHSSEHDIPGMGHNVDPLLYSIKQVIFFFMEYIVCFV